MFPCRSPPCSDTPDACKPWSTGSMCSKKVLCNIEDISYGCICAHTHIYIYIHIHIVISYQYVFFTFCSIILRFIYRIILNLFLLHIEHCNTLFYIISYHIISYDVLVQYINIYYIISHLKKHNISCHMSITAY